MSTRASDRLLQPVKKGEHGNAGGLADILKENELYEDVIS